jgi:ubiquinone/menaquinone biosynthesis C-methylase UbiE
MIYVATYRAVADSPMVDHENWQLVGSAPELYQRYLVPAITSLWATDLVERAQPRPGEAVLDVACGTGVVTRPAAQRVATGRVIGLDFNGGMLAVAQSLPATGLSIDWIEASALDLPFRDSCFDLILCQLGLQFFPDKPRALGEMKRVLARAGRIALSAYSAIERTPGAHAFARALDGCLGPDASNIKRAEHVFSHPDEVTILLSAAGFEQVNVCTVAKTITFPSALDYVRFQLVATPMAALLKDRGADERESTIRSVADRIRSNLDPNFLRDGRLSFPQETLVATAHQSR